MKRISIIGSGNVGRRIGEYFSRKNKVLFYDIDKEVLEYLEQTGKDVTEDISCALEETEISFIAVPTPLSNSGCYDNSYIRSVARDCGENLEKHDYHVFVLKSTVTPGTTEKEFIPRIEKFSRKREGREFGVVYNPEFLSVIENTWTKDENFSITPEKEGRIVLGEGKRNKTSGDMVEGLYRELTDAPVLRTDYKTAEMAKLAANSRLALAISFSNEIFLQCKELRKNGFDIDYEFIIKSMSFDPRIGKYGSVFGKAYGGPCLPKDTEAFKNFLLKKSGKNPKILSSSIEVNNEMKRKYGVRE